MRKARVLLLLLAHIIVVTGGGHPPTFGARVPTQNAQTYMPKTGSVERKAILDTVRSKLNVQNQFVVNHLKVNNQWAYFSGDALAVVDGERFETDSVKALLERRGEAGKQAWVVVEIWTLERTGDEMSRRKFVDGVKEKRKAEDIPDDLFPREM